MSFASPVKSHLLLATLAYDEKPSAIKRITSNLKSLVTKGKPAVTSPKPPPLYSVITQMTTVDGIKWVRTGTSGMEFRTYLHIYNIFRETITVTLYEAGNGEFYVRDEAPRGGMRRHLITEFQVNDGRELWQQTDGSGRTMYSSGRHERELHGLIERLDADVWGRGAWILRDAAN